MEHSGWSMTWIARNSSHTCGIVVRLKELDGKVVKTITRLDPELQSTLRAQCFPSMLMWTWRKAYNDRKWSAKEKKRIEEEERAARKAARDERQRQQV